MSTESRPLVDALTALGLPPEADPAPETPTDGFIAQWPAQRVLRLSGPDTRKFLQGQLTCQIDLLDQKHSVLGASCTPKGKALANFRLIALGESDILLRLSAELEQPTHTHFQKYLALFKAKMETVDDWTIVGLTGEKSLTALGVDWQPEPGTVRPWGQSLLVGSQPDAHGLSRVELWLNSADLSHFEACLENADRQLLAPQSAWLAGEIQAGLMTIDERLRDRYVPQYFNWHAVEGISFRKGCYTGQEIIARMRYLGQLKKSTYRVLLPQGGGTVLGVITDSTGRAAGEITNLVNFQDGRQEALAVIKHSATTGGLQLADAPQCPVLIGSLPYTVPEQEAPSEK